MNAQENETVNKNQDKIITEEEKILLQKQFQSSPDNNKISH